VCGHFRQAAVNEIFTLCFPYLGGSDSDMACSALVLKISFWANFSFLFACRVNEKENARREGRALKRRKILKPIRA